MAYAYHEWDRWTLTVPCQHEHTHTLTHPEQEVLLHFNTQNPHKCAHSKVSRNINPWHPIFPLWLFQSEQTFQALNKYIQCQCFTQILFFPPESETMTAVMVWSDYETFFFFKPYATLDSSVHFQYCITHNQDYFIVLCMEHRVVLHCPCMSKSNSTQHCYAEGETQEVCSFPVFLWVECVCICVWVRVSLFL